MFAEKITKANNEMKIIFWVYGDDDHDDDDDYNGSLKLLTFKILNRYTCWVVLLISALV